MQTIQPDPQILTMCMKETVFQEKATTTKKLLNKAYFILIFHWLVRQWSSWPVRTNEKYPENNWKSTWTKQPETAFRMCHSFDPFNHELSCNSLNSPWHQTKVSVFYINTCIYTLTYSKMLRIRGCIFWSLAKQTLIVWSTYWKFRLNRFLIRFFKFLWRRILLLITRNCYIWYLSFIIGIYLPKI